MFTKWFRTTILLLLVLVIFAPACNSIDEAAVSEVEQNIAAGYSLVLPPVEAVQLDNRPLRVIATTSIIGDVVAKIGGDKLELNTLITHDQDPHSYEPGAGEFSAVTNADIVFVNGWDLEESLVNDLETIAGDIPVAAVGANIVPLHLDDSDHERLSEIKEVTDNGRIDPHTWLSVPNVMQWVENITQILSELDPDNAPLYEANAESYLNELEEVDTYIRSQVAGIPEEKRVLVTNHGVFNYFAKEYGFQIAGTILPSTSTQAEPSAGDLAALIMNMEELGACTIFTDIAANDNLAKTVAAELSGCDEVKIIPIYTGSLGPRGSSSEHYIGMMMENVDKIVEVLQ